MTDKHPIRSIRERWPRLLRVIFIPKMYRLYRGWGNDRLSSLALTWRAVVWR